MKLLILERDLMWSVKMKSQAEKLGWEAIVTMDPQPADAAIVSLIEPSYSAVEKIESLQKLGVKVIAHAGHVEEEKLQMGRDAGADLVVVNGALSRNLGMMLEKLFGPEHTASADSQ
jgi:putative N-acetylmannosamine-6-phosphate epimerase